MLSELLFGTGTLISGFALLPNSIWTKGLYMVMIGATLGIVMNGFGGPNRVDIVLEENNLRRVKAKDLQKTKMNYPDIVHLLALTYFLELAQSLSLLR